MANIKHSIEELIGNTPLLELDNYERKFGLKARILLKVESVNILGSLKDRIAVAMIDALEAETDIKPGDTIVENSSGNTAIALAAVARKRGYRFVDLITEQTPERTKLLLAYGAELEELYKIPEIAEKLPELSDDYRLEQLIDDYFEERGKREGRRYFFTKQWANPANKKVQREVTAQEILRDTDGNVDVFIGGIGSGGSFCGITEGLRAANPNLEAIAFDSTPEEPDSIVGVHNIATTPKHSFSIFTQQGTKTYDRTIVVTKEQAYRASNEVGKAEGIIFGISTGAALHIATELAKLPEYEGKTIVAIAYDDVMKYLSTELVSEEYRK